MKNNIKILLFIITDTFLHFYHVCSAMLSNHLHLIVCNMPVEKVGPADFVYFVYFVYILQMF